MREIRFKCPHCNEEYFHVPKGTPFGTPYCNKCGKKMSQIKE